MGASVVRCGDVGAGNTTKLANQIIVACNIQALAEALTLAQKADVDPELVFQAIKGGLAGSTVMNAKAPMMIEGNDKPVEVLDYNALKDDPLIDATTIGLSGSPTNILTSFTPPQKGVGMMLEGADAATAEKLAGMLAAKHII